MGPAKKISPLRFPRKYQRLSSDKCSIFSNADFIWGGGNPAKAAPILDSIDCDLVCSPAEIGKFNGPASAPASTRNKATQSGCPAAIARAPPARR